VLLVTALKYVAQSLRDILTKVHHQMIQKENDNIGIKEVDCQFIDASRIKIATYADNCINDWLWI
jgi:hypothetical protein